MSGLSQQWDFPYWWDVIFNSLAPGRYVSNLKKIIFKLIIQNSSQGIACENVLM